MNNQMENILNHSKESLAYRMLLSRFVTPQLDHAISRQEAKWMGLLGESSKQALNFFLNHDLLALASIEDRMNKKYSVANLKEIITKKGQKATGKKNDLIEKALEVARDEMVLATADMKLYVCTESGKRIAEKYLSSREAERKDYGTRVLNLVIDGQYKKAVEVARQYYEPEMDLRENENFGLNNDAYDLKKITWATESTPGILSKMDTDLLGKLRLAYIMSIFAPLDIVYSIPKDTPTGIPLDLETSLRMFSFYIDSKIERLQFEAEGVKRLEVLACNDSCSQCKKLNGKRFKISEAPELPNPSCTDPCGCRCTFLAVID